MKYLFSFAFVLICGFHFSQLECSNNGCQFCLEYIKNHCDQNSGWKASWFQTVPQTRGIDIIQENQNKAISIENKLNNQHLIINSDLKKEYSVDFPSNNKTEDFQIDFTINPKSANDQEFDLKIVLVDNLKKEFWFKFFKVQQNLLKLETPQGTCEVEFYQYITPIKLSFKKNIEGKLQLEISQVQNKTYNLIFKFPGLEDFQNYIVEPSDLSPRIRSIKISNDNKIKGSSWTISKLSINKTSENSISQNESNIESSLQTGRTNVKYEYVSKNKIYALYIFNENYTVVDKLKRPESDALQLNSTLKSKIGEFYTSDFISNLATNSFKLDTFTSQKYLDQMKESDIIIVHYGGHGISFGGSNHWLPIDFSDKIKPDKNFLGELKEDSELRKKQIDQYIKSRLENQDYTIKPIKLLEVLNDKLQDKIIIFISDACRNEIKLNLEVPQTGRAVDPIETKEYIEENFFDLNENFKNYLFLQYSVSALAKANDMNSYTSQLAKLISDQNLLYTSNGRIDDILQEVFRKNSLQFSRTSYNNKANQLNKFNFLINNWEEFKKTLK